MKKHKGEIVKKSSKNTVVVLVKSVSMHPVYKKVMTTTKRFLVHDENEKHKVGDIVEIIQVRPLSKRKNYKINEVVKNNK